MHGENECFGNIQQLCAAKYWNYVDEESVQIREPYSDTWNVSTLSFSSLSGHEDELTILLVIVLSMYECWNSRRNWITSNC